MLAAILVIGGVGAYNVIHINGSRQSLGPAQEHPGWGVYIVVAGAAVALIGGWLERQRASAEWPPA